MDDGTLNNNSSVEVGGYGSMVSGLQIQCNGKWVLINSVPNSNPVIVGTTLKGGEHIKIDFAFEIVNCILSNKITKVGHVAKQESTALVSNLHESRIILVSKSE